MSHKSHRNGKQGVPGWVKIVAWLIVATSTTAGAGHVGGTTAPAPIKVYVELQAPFAGRVS